jgi:hypothetical protein
MKILKHIAVAAAVLMFLSTAAMADLVITPTTGQIDVSRWEGDETSQAEINGIIFSIFQGSPVLLYKDDTPSTSLFSSYSTTLNSDNSGGTIEWIGGPFAGGQVYLLVKDGAHSPGWYLFDLTALGWDGKETLALSGFWPGQGAISHLAIYGTTSVPEPTTLLLLGAGLLGVGILSRKLR